MIVLHEPRVDADVGEPLVAPGLRKEAALVVPA
jgi:hypothetical protein